MPKDEWAAARRKDTAKRGVRLGKRKRRRKRSSDRRNAGDRRPSRELTVAEKAVHLGVNGARIDVATVWDRIRGQDGMSILPRVATHWQVLFYGSPIVDIWPTTGRFRVSDATGEAVIGKTADVVLLVEYVVNERTGRTSG